MRQTFATLGLSPRGPILLGSIYCAVAILSLLLTSGGNSIATVWPPSGILLATLLIVPRRAMWRFVLAGVIASFAANWLAGSGLLLSMGFTAANGVEALLAALLLRRRSRQHVSFLDSKGLSGFFLVSLLATATSAVMATIANPLADAHFLLSWFTTTWLGILLVTPPLMMTFELLMSRRKITFDTTATEFLVIALAATVICTITFFQSRYPILFLPIIVIIVAVLRGGAIGGIISMIIAAITGTWALTLGSGPASLIDASNAVRGLFFQFYLLALFASALPMATLLASRNRLRTDLAERIRLLDQAERLAHIGHWRVNATDQTLFWSPEVFRIHGLPEGPPPPLDKAIDAYHPDDRARIMELVNRALTLGQPYAFEARLVRSDGTIRHVASRGERDYSSTDDAIGLFGLIQDITEQVEAKRILQEARDAAERSAQAAQALAHTDALTGLTNRRGIMQYLHRAMEQATTDRGHLSVVMFDIDHFKSVNDRYGHDVGDDVLRQVARSAALGLRGTDLLGRYGGEEFILILPHAPAEVAVHIAERIRRKVEASGNGQQVGVTISLGVAAFTGTESAKDILKRADIALYDAKNAGRNRLSLAA